MRIDDNGNVHGSDGKFDGHVPTAAEDGARLRWPDSYNPTTPIEDARARQAMLEEQMTAVADAADQNRVALTKALVLDVFPQAVSAQFSTNSWDTVGWTFSSARDAHGQDIAWWNEERYPALRDEIEELLKRLSHDYPDFEKFNYGEYGSLDLR